MSVYSKALRHVDNKDFRKTHHRRLDEQKVLRNIEREKKLQERKEIEEIKKLSSPFKYDWRSDIFPQEESEQVQVVEEIKVKVPEKLKSNWRKEVNEGMTTGGGEIQLAPTDVPLDTLDAANAASFTASVGGFDATNPQDGLMGAQIVSNGTGSGSNGGFNLGRNYLSFNGVGFDLSGSGFEGFDNTRKVIFTPVDASRATTLEVTAIVGNGSNGGEAPSIGQDITFGYTLADQIGLLTPLDDDENPFVVVPYNGSGFLRTYSFTIPDYLRIPGIQFVLGQFQGTNPTTTNDNYGITQIKIKRTTPISVFAPLDTPEAVSFFRTGTGPNMETPEQRYRRIMQQLLASRSYTNQMFGSNYPGSNFSGLSNITQPPTWQQAAQQQIQAEVQQTSTNYQNSISDFEKTFSDLKTELSSISAKATALQSFNKLVQGKEPAFAVGALEGMDSAKQSEVLKALGTTASSTFNQIQQYKELNQKLSQSKNPADWDKAVQVSGSIQQLYDKFGKEMKGEIGKAVSLPPDLNQNKFAEIDKKIAELKASAKQSAIDARNNELAAVGVGAGFALIATLLVGGLIASTAVAAPSAAARVATAFDALKKSADAAKAAKAAAARSMGQNSKGTGMGDRWSGPQFNSYEPQGEIILEKKMKTFKQFSKALYPGQPSPNGFPDQPPPQQLPNGFHQDYGQKDNMYNTLDKTSAMSMPPTGNPEIDKKVEKAKKQPK